ncbi:hypothetical protein ACP4OV_016544 [Aristida adscensionis]
MSGHNVDATISGASDKDSGVPPYEKGANAIVADQVASPAKHVPGEA